MTWNGETKFMNRDIRWYIGFIAGAAGCGLLLKYGEIEISGIVRLVLVIGVGVGCGWAAEALWKRQG
jgi:hypothetical protein